MTRGAIYAVAIRVLKVLEDTGRAGKAKIVGFDNHASVGSLIKSGKMLATFDCFGSQMAAEGIRYAMKALQDKKHKDCIKT